MRFYEISSFFLIITVQFLDFMRVFRFIRRIRAWGPELCDAIYRQLLTDLCEAKTLSQITSALWSIPPLPDVSHIALPTLRPESRLIIRDGVEGGMITQSEYLIAKVASDHRIHQRVSKSFIETVKRHDFNPDESFIDLPCLFMCRRGVSNHEEAHVQWRVVDSSKREEAHVQWRVTESTKRR